MERVLGVTWLFTAACPLNCRHCYTLSLRGRRELSLEDKRRLAREIIELDVEWVNITGGEPLAHPHFWEIAELLSDHGVAIYVNTSGVGLGAEEAKKLSRIAAAVYVSIDGSPVSHESLRGRNTFAKAVNAIKYLREYGVEYTTVMAVTEDNAGYVRDYVRLAAGLGVDYPALIPVMRQGAARSEARPVTASTMLRAILDASSEARRLGLGGVWLWCTPYAAILGLDNVFSTTCRTRRIIDISPSGDIMLCDISGIVVTSIRGHRLVDAIQEYQRSRIVEEVVNPPRLPLACMRCPIAEQCRGGCFARSILEHGDPNRGDPLCPRIALGEKNSGANQAF